MREYREFIMKTIMVATDFSETSYGAINYAAQLATRLSAKLLLVHVVDRERSASAAVQTAPSLAKQIDAAEEELETIYTGLHHDGIRCAMIVRPGDTGEVVFDLVQERDVDLLVIGTRGQGHPDEEDLGSVAELLLRSMPCPVLTVRQNVRQDACEGTHSRVVLFPTDFSEISRAALAYAECLTKYFAGRLLLLHVDETQHSEHTDEFHRLVEGTKDTSLVVEHITRVGRPADVIVAVSSERRADFIVMGVHGADQENSTTNHGIAFDVIRSARCPVFTLFGQPKKAMETTEQKMTEAEEFHLQQRRLAIRHS